MCRDPFENDLELLHELTRRAQERSVSDTVAYAPPDWRGPFRRRTPRLEEGLEALPAQRRHSPFLADHRSEPPHGVGAIGAWELPGGRGEYARVVVMERGWAGHRDLTGHDLEPVAGEPLPASRAHGLATLGVLAAAGDSQLGIVPDIPPGSLRLAATHLRDDGDGFVPALLRVLARLEGVGCASLFGSSPEGTVLLIEWQDANQHPVEADEAAYELIRLATALGITVIEPSGNGAEESGVDELDELHVGYLADRGPGDSGAIVVSGIDPAGGVWHTDCMRGDRIDAHAWASGVASLAPGDGYTGTYDGSSAASAIIAGVAAQMQSLHWAARCAWLRPRALRELFRTYGERRPGLGRFPDVRRCCRALELVQPLQLAVHNGPGELRATSSETAVVRAWRRPPATTPFGLQWEEYVQGTGQVTVETSHREMWLFTAQVEPFEAPRGWNHPVELAIARARGEAFQLVGDWDWNICGEQDQRQIDLVGLPLAPCALRLTFAADGVPPLVWRVPPSLALLLGAGLSLTHDLVAVPLEMLLSEDASRRSVDIWLPAGAHHPLILAAEGWRTPAEPYRVTLVVEALALGHWIKTAHFTWRIR